MTTTDRNVYQQYCRNPALTPYRLQVQQTALFILARQDVRVPARQIVLDQRRALEAFIEDHPGFATALKPWPEPSGPTPPLVAEMISAGRRTGTGPMAAVAGALAQKVAGGVYRLNRGIREIIVENGGDIFIYADTAQTVAIYAGASPLSLKLGIRLKKKQLPTAVCTSSASVGHSLSFGRADAVCVVAPGGAFADAAATAIANHAVGPEAVRNALDFGKSLGGVTGVVVVMGEAAGFFGDIEIVPLQPKKT